jgi:hypothetical protein
MPDEIRRLKAIEFGLGRPRDRPQKNQDQAAQPQAAVDLAV